MTMPRNAWLMVCVILTTLGTSSVSSQPAATGSGTSFPTKPIRIVASPPGGSIDFAARLVAQGLASSAGWQVVVDNRPTGFIQGQIVTQAPADGHMLLIAGSSFWTAPLLQKSPYDVFNDFSPIIVVEKSPNVVAVHPSLPAKSIKELIVLARARPGQLNYGSSGTGASNHLAAELFKAMAAVNIVQVNYKGGGPAISGLVSGEVEVMFASTASVAPHVKSGKLRALAVTSAHPSALAPGLPPIATSGVPGYDSVGATSIFGPAKIPAAVISRLNQEIARAISQPDIKEKFLGAASEIAPGTPEDLLALMKSDTVKMGKVIKDAGIRAE